MFPTRVYPNPKPGFFGYFLLPETRAFFNYQTRELKNWNRCSIQILAILITLKFQIGACNGQIGTFELSASDGFTHRPNRPWPRAPRFCGPRAALSYDDSIFANLRRGTTSQFTLKRAEMQMSTVDSYQYSAGPSPAGEPVVPGPPIWYRCPHFTFGPPVATYIQYCILKMWSPFWFLVPPAAKSWRRAWYSNNMTILCIWAWERSRPSLWKWVQKRMKKKKGYLIDVQFSTDKKLATTILSALDPTFACFY